jgi:serine kinase of HPr protein (carbohydrate metabolism regulator)
MGDDGTTIHGGSAALGGQGVLLLGPPGAGKSDLLLRLIDGGAYLVADDRVVLRASGADVLASPPDRLAGVLEVRGLGLTIVPYLAAIPIALAVRLTPAERIVRVPEPEAEELLPGLSVPLLRLDPNEASAPAKLRFALQVMAGGRLLPTDWRPD